MLILSLLLQAAPIEVTGPRPGAAQPPATMAYEPAALLIATFDADGDARVTREEMEDGLIAAFNTIDTAKAGTLGYLAFADWAERFLGDRNALPSPFEVDRDGDNRVSLRELQTRFSEYFTRYDRDKDGLLTRAELLTIRARVFGDDGPPKDGKKRK
ncbi:EF-hand domain-containing protein [Sphingomonas dokdonensis]|uniref:EF-hand domain-containing protein n=1 Tax=Sphingomonas dokdonensis TaxID=344880 RepID=A0A245ZIB0_9SPHN|nr:EF-hand domain-containing protein [Sphingomonas dokdonensis]OWK29475.1 hypothetical protein SPDO_24650 [Sphingomonas dokdonensis]